MSSRFRWWFQGNWWTYWPWLIRRLISSSIARWADSSERPSVSSFADGSFSVVGHQFPSIRTTMATPELITPWRRSLRSSPGVPDERFAIHCKKTLPYTQTHTNLNKYRKRKLQDVRWLRRWIFIKVKFSFEDSVFFLTKKNESFFEGTKIVIVMPFNIYDFYYLFHFTPSSKYIFLVSPRREGRVTTIVKQIKLVLFPFPFRYWLCHPILCFCPCLVFCIHRKLPSPTRFCWDSDMDHVQWNCIRSTRFRVTTL